MSRSGAGLTWSPRLNGARYCCRAPQRWPEEPSALLRLAAVPHDLDEALDERCSGAPEQLAAWAAREPWSVEPEEGRALLLAALVCLERLDYWSFAPSNGTPTVLRDALTGPEDISTVAAMEPVDDQFRGCTERQEVPLALTGDAERGGWWRYRLPAAQRPCRAGRSGPRSRSTMSPEGTAAACARSATSGSSQSVRTGLRAMTDRELSLWAGLCARQADAAARIRPGARGWWTDQHEQVAEEQRREQPTGTGLTKRAPLGLKWALGDAERLHGAHAAGHGCRSLVSRLSSWPCSSSQSLNALGNTAGRLCVSVTFRC